MTDTQIDTTSAASTVETAPALPVATPAVTENAAELPSAAVFAPVTAPAPVTVFPPAAVSVTASAPPAERLMSRREAARELRVCLRTLDNLRAARAIEYIRIGGTVRFTPAALAKYLASRTVTAVA